MIKAHPNWPWKRPGKPICPVCKQGNVFRFPAPEPHMSPGLACTNPNCDWIETTDGYYAEHALDTIDTRRRELAT